MNWSQGIKPHLLHTVSQSDDQLMLPMTGDQSWVTGLKKHNWFEKPSFYKPKKNKF